MSGSSKFGRGRGASRLVTAPPPPLGRGMAMPPLRRQSMPGMGKERREGGGGGGGGGGGMGRMGNARGGESGRGGGPVTVASQEESFQLLQEQGVRPFAMAIRLTPELLCDLKRVEAEGGACLMKFGVTPAGHVIKIGDEEFKFSSAPEPGHLCDIFEEQRRGEDGNGILREAGSVWRKLSVLRTLNASEKDRVKNRSMEAEQKQKSRKAIILDPTHSMVNNQNAGTGDVLGRRAPMKTKKEPPTKKLKVTTSSPAPIPVPVSAPAPKPMPVASTASVIASAKAAKAASVASPELPPPVKAVAAPLPLPKAKPSPEEGSAPALNKSTTVVQKDSPPSPATTTPDIGGPAKLGGVISASELRNCLITLLTENPKGMTIKAVEKALGETMPHVKPERKTIEKAIKAIASYHAPGKYMLKEGVSFAKPSPNSGSSPENAAADSPPLVDSPALPDMAADSSNHDQVTDGVYPSESGLLGDKPGASHSVATGKASSIVHKSNESAMSRAIRKASESYQKSQPQSTDSFKPSPATPSQKPESGSVKEQEAGLDAEQVSIGGDESPDTDVIEGESQLDTIVTEFENRKGGDISAPSSPKEEARATNSGGSDSSSSSDSSDSDSDSSDSGDSHSASSGSGSDSDSDGSSSSASDDENMDEDVEIVSDDEEGDGSHHKSKGKDKKQASRHAKEAKRAKLKPPEKLLTAQDSEEVDIGGDEAGGHTGVDPEERATVVVENLDINDDIEVDVISVGGAGSPHESGSVSPAVSQRQSGESLKEVAVTDTTQEKPSVSKQQGSSVKNSSDVDQSVVEEKRVGSEPRDAALADKKRNRDLPQKTMVRGTSPSQSREEPTKAGENNWVEKESLGKAPEVEKPKPITLKGRINGMAHNRMAGKHSPVNINTKVAAKESPVHTNNRPPARDSPAHSASPSRPEIGAKSLLGSPALRKDATETSPRPTKESIAKRRGNPDFRKSFSKEAEIAAKTAKDLESEELVDKIVEAPTRPWPRPNKSADLTNRAAKQLDPPQPLHADAHPEFGTKGLRDSEATGATGREIEAEIPPSASRPFRDGTWRHNPDAGLLGKPGKNVEYLGRPQIRETEPNNLYGNRQLKNMRRPNIEPEATRRNEPVNDSDSWGKPTKDVDGPVRSGNESEVPINRLREGRKELIRQEAPKGSLLGGASKQNEKKSRESPDLELGELRESTPGTEQWDNRGREGLRTDPSKTRDGLEAAAISKPLPNKAQCSPARDKARSASKNAGDLRKPSPGKTIGDLRKPSPIKSVGDFRKPSPGKAAGDLRKPSPVKPVGDLRKHSPGKAAGDLRKPSPATSSAQKLAQVAQKELQKLDQIVARDSTRAATGSGKHPSTSQVEERPEVPAGRNGRAVPNDTSERPTESRGVKRPLEEGTNPESARVYKKPSIAPAAPSSSLNRGNLESGPAGRAEKKQVSPDLLTKPQSAEPGRAGSLEGPSSLAGPSGKAPSGENSRKQRPFIKAQKASEREASEPPRGRDLKAKTSVGLLGSGGEKRKDSLPPDPLSNGKRLKASSSPDEVTRKEYFVKYEKDTPELRGPIRTYEEAESYKKEYQTKYSVYHRLYTDIDKNKGQFAAFRREMELAGSHPDKLQQISTKVRREFQAVRKEFKRMQKTFDILHEELQTIKQQLKNFAEKAGQG